ARTGSGPPLDEVRRWAQDEIAADRRPSIFTSAELNEGALLLAATSFVGFLLDAHGADPLRRFLAAYDPERRDAAAQAAYERPIGALEEAWQASLVRHGGSRKALRQLFGYLFPLVKPYWARWLEIAFYLLYGVAFSLA